jgi:hypothetical protein
VRVQVHEEDAAAAREFLRADEEQGD